MLGLLERRESAAFQELTANQSNRSAMGAEQTRSASLHRRGWLRQWMLMMFLAWGVSFTGTWAVTSTWFLFVSPFVPPADVIFGALYSDYLGP